MGAIAIGSERPFPPGAYDVVVVGSGPGGVQTAYELGRLGVRHALVSADDGPGGMFRKWPLFQRLITWTKPEAPVPRTSRAYERYDQNSLISDDEQLRALVPAAMSSDSVFPTRAEMAAGHAAFVERAGVQIRNGCRWIGTRRDERGLVLTTSDGDYACRAAVFAVGVTEPWKPPIPGLDQVPHYADTQEPQTYRDKRLVIIGKRNSAFELAHALLPWARSIVLVSPRPVRADVLARSSVRVRYFQPLEDYSHGGGTIVLDAAVERVERSGDGTFLVHVEGTRYPGKLALPADEVIATTGFSTPFQDLAEVGVESVARGRIPALTPFWESIGAPGVFFAGNASQGARGLSKNGVWAISTAVPGHRYNSRLLAQHLAERLLGSSPERPRIRRGDAATLLAGELATAPELWIQKGYLARAIALDSSEEATDHGVVPLEHFVDAGGPDAAAVTVELDAAGTIHPVVYVRREGRVREVPLDPDPMNAFDGPRYRRELDALLAPRATPSRRRAGVPSDPARAG